MTENTAMEGAAEAGAGTLRLEPLVAWPRTMAVGRRYLVSIDLRLVEEEWPAQQEELAFTCLLDGGGQFEVEAVHDASVLIHRFGGSYGAAEYVVEPVAEVGAAKLWLTIITARGIPVRTAPLEIEVVGVDVEEHPTTTVATDVLMPTAAVSSVAARGVRLCIAVDYVGLASHANIEFFRFRDVLSRIVQDACVAVVSDSAQIETVQGGDGEMIVMPPELDLFHVVPDFIHAVEQSLRTANEQLSTGRPLRITLGLDAGVVYQASNGHTDAPVVTANRLCDSDEAREVMRYRGSLMVAVISNTLMDAAGLGSGRSDLSGTFDPVIIEQNGTQYEAEAYVPLSAIGLDPDRGDQAPYFFLSYALGASQRNTASHVRKFFDDLSGDISQLVAPARHAPIGFMDPEPAAGKSWERDLLYGLSTCQVFIPLYSSTYFRSAWCGRAWDAFSRRRARSTAQSSRQSTAIIPVIWAPFRLAEMPLVCKRIQFIHKAFSSSYGDNGLYGLLQTGREDEYRATVFQLARTIVDVARATRLEPCDVSLFSDLRNVFEDEQTPDSGG